MLRSSSHLQLMAGDRTAPPRPANWGRATWLRPGHRTHYSHRDTGPEHREHSILVHST